MQNKTSKAAKYPFPIRDVPTILEFLHKEVSELNLTADDIKRPKSNVIQSLYLKILEMLGIHQDQIFQTQFGKVQEYVEYHEYTNRVVHLSLAMRRIMHTCGYDSFNLQDVTDPDFPRLQVILSALLNIFYFSKDREQEYQSLIKEKSQVLEQKRQLKEENEAMQLQISNIRAKREQQKSEIEMLNQKVAQTKIERDDLIASAAEVKKLASAAKVVIAELRLKKVKLEDAIKAARQRGEMLSQQIVQSPERMKMEREQMEKHLQEVKEMKLGMQEQRENMVRRFNIYSAMLKKLDTVCETMQSMQQDISKHHEVAEWLGSLEKQNQQKKEALTELQTNSQQLRCQLTRKQEKLSRLNLQYDNALASLRESLAQEKRNAELLTQQRGEVMEMERERQAVLEKTNQFNVKCDQMQDILIDKYEKLLEEVERYNLTLQQGFGNIKQSMEDMKISRLE